MCGTLNEGYLRAANRGSNSLYRFLSKYKISAFNEKTIVLVYLLLFLFETADLGTIAVFFWQSFS